MSEIDDAIRRVKVRSSGRTRYEGSEPYDEETLADEVARLRAAFLHHIKAKNECRSFFDGGACKADKCGCLLEMQGYIAEQGSEDRK